MKGYTPNCDPMRVATLLGLSAAVLAAACSDSRSRPEDAGGPELGAACTGSMPCAGGLACVTGPEFPGGYCSATCDGTPCPAGGRCVDGFGARLCFAMCSSSASCRMGYQCWLGACQPPCRTSGDCGGAGATCTDGRCVGPECTMDAECGLGRRCLGTRCVDPPPDGGVIALVGEPCTRSVECETGLCLPADHGGLCATPCSDSATCGGGSVCVPFPLDSDGDGMMERVGTACAPADPVGNFLGATCSDPSTCESHTCIDGECDVACDDDTDCLPGQRCTTISLPGATDPTFLGCGDPPPAAGSETLDVDLGTVTATTGFPTRRISFSAPRDAVSLTLIATQPGGSEPLPLTFVDVYNPANSRLFDFGSIAMYMDQPIRWLPIDSEESIAMLVPNSTTDRIEFLPGRHGVTLALLERMAGDSATSDINLTARIKRAPGGMPGRTLDINMFLVGVGLTEGTAPSSTRLQGALDEMRSIFGAAGVTLGTINYIQITGTAASTLSVIDTSDGATSEMAQLFRLSAGQTNNAVDVFLVRGISAGAGERGGIALGIAGGIPGPPSVHGTMHSGVVVSYDVMVVGDDPRVIAQIMTHEISHYLGLFHNTENGRPCGPGETPTATTPCAPFGGGDVLSDTAYRDGSNLMYFALGGLDGRTYNVNLSFGQAYVMSRSALLR